MWRWLKCVVLHRGNWVRDDDTKSHCEFCGRTWSHTTSAIMRSFRRVP